MLGSTGDFSCLAMENNYIRHNELSDKKQWESYDREMKQVADVFSAFTYAPPKYTAFLMGDFLLQAEHFHTGTPEKLGALARHYLSQFPNSPYNYLIRKRLFAYAAQNVSHHVPFACFESGTGFSYQPLAGADTISDLSAFVKMQFPGQAMFVDCWATYCGPCREQFRYTPALDKFLEGHHIAMLYLSLDKPVMTREWKKMIEDYQLSGTHYIASNAMNHRLSQLFTGIPRYLLFDKNGQLVGADMMRPQAGKQLQEQILAKLGQ